MSQNLLCLNGFLWFWPMEAIGAGARREFAYESEVEGTIILQGKVYSKRVWA